MTTSDAPEEKTFKNIVGKGENAGNQCFLLFSPCFLLYERQAYVLIAICKCLGKAWNFAIG